LPQVVFGHSSESIFTGSEDTTIKGCVIPRESHRARPHGITNATPTVARTTPPPHSPAEHTLGAARRFLREAVPARAPRAPRGHRRHFRRALGGPAWARDRPAGRAESKRTYSVRSLYPPTVQAWAGGRNGNRDEN
jgi:hypothetical protein